MFAQKYKISKHTISNNHRALIIAEVGINHEGSFSKCIKLINQANSAGADLIKLQIIDPESSYEPNTFPIKYFKNQNLQKKKFLIFIKFVKKKI